MIPINAPLGSRLSDNGMELALGTWLAVCDGQRALLFENEGAGGVPKLRTHETFVQDNPPSHLQGTAAPGRAFGTEGRRAATAETDFHEQAATAFLGRFAEHINRGVAAGRIDSLVLIAPARALGILRAQLSEQARHVVTAELHKDYVKQTVAEIERHLTTV